MAVRFATAGDFLDYTTASPNTAAVTVTAWVYLVASTANPQEIIRIRSSADGTVVAFKALDLGGSLRLGGPTTSFDSTAGIPGGVWTAVACTVNGTAGVIYQQDSTKLSPTVTSGTIDTGTGAKYSLGGRGGSDTGENMNGRLAAVKIWQRVLTQDEIIAEWGRVLPVNTAALYAAYPFDSMATTVGQLDVSGNGHMLIAGSTLTEAGPPIPRWRTLSRPWLAAVNSSYTRTTSDTLTLSDTIARSAQTFTRTMVDSVGLADAQARAAQAFARTTADAVGLADSVARGAQTFARSATDSVGAADAFTRSINRTTTDTVGLSDLQTRSAQTLLRSVTDTANIADSISRAAQTFIRTDADTLGLADTQARSQTFTRSVADTLGSADTQNRAAQTGSRTLSDTLGLADTETVSHTHLTSDTLTLSDAATRSMSGWKRGINDAGGEFGDPADGGTLPGTYGVDYQYDSAGTLTYLASRGHTIVRLPFLWERIQPTLGGALDPTELLRLQAYVNRAASAGLRVVLDVHNYARYSPPPGSTTYVLGDGNLAQSHFSDLWQRLSAAFKGNPGIAGYGLMNEPHDVLPVPGTFSGTVRYNWNDGTVQGWTGDTATASNVSNQLRLTGTVPGGSFWDMRKDDNGTVSGGNTPTGNVLEVTATLNASSPAGSWQVLLQWQTSGPSFTWVTNATTTYVRLDTNQAVAALVPGVACSVRAVFPSNITNPNKFAIQVQANTPSAGTVIVDFDDYSQGTVSGYSSPTQVWEQTAQGCVTAIRGNGDNTTVMVSTYPWAQPNVAANHPTAWIVDSAGAGLVRYESHIYFDDDISGRYQNTFATETTLAAGEGYPSVQARTLARLAQFTTWLSNQGVLGYLGEVGWPNGSDATSWNAVGTAFYSALASAGVWVTYWSTGELWGTNSATYPMVAYMQAGAGQPVSVANAQAPIIEALPNTGMVRSLSDTLGVADAVTRSLPRAVSDTLGVADTQSRSVQAVTRATTDTVGAADTVTRATQGFTRAVAGALGLADAQARAAQAFARSATDTVGLADTQVRAAQSFTRSLANAPYPSSGLYPSGSLYPGATGDIVTLADTVGLRVSRTTIDALGLADAQSRAPQVFTRSTADSLTVADSQTRAAQARTRTVTDTLNLADVQINAVRGFSDGLTVADTQTRAVQARTRATVDSVGVSETQVRATQTLTRAVSDLLGLADTQARSAQAVVRAVTDTLGLADGQNRAAQAVTRAVADSVGVADTQSRSPQNRARVTVEAVGLSDSQLRSTQAVARATSDSVGLADSTAPVAGTHFFTDVVVFSDAQSRAAQSRVRSVSDAAPLSDLTVRATAATRGFADTTALADQVRVVSLARLAADAVTMSDQVLRSLLFGRGTTDVLGVSDAIADTGFATIVWPIHAGTPVFSGAYSTTASYITR